MKAKDIQIGARYAAKVSGTVQTVKILSESPYGGWVARNTATGREVRIKSPQRLRYEIRPAREAAILSLVSSPKTR